MQDTELYLVVINLTATKLDNESLDYLESLSQIEPTHQSYEVMGARALAKVFHNIKQSATFDTSFHRTMPEVAEFIQFLKLSLIMVCVIGASTVFHMLILVHN